MPGKKIKKVDGIGQKLLDEAIADFMRHCRLKNLAEATMEYYQEDLEYKNLTYANMEAFIAAQDGAESAAMKEYKTIKRLSEGKNGSYAHVKKWFLNKYSEAFEAQENTAE